MSGGVKVKVVVAVAGTAGFVANCRSRLDVISLMSGGGWDRLHL